MTDPKSRSPSKSGTEPLTPSKHEVDLEALVRELEVLRARYSALQIGISAHDYQLAQHLFEMLSAHLADLRLRARESAGAS